MLDADAPQLRHVRRQPARPGVHVPWPAWVSEDVRTAYERVGVPRPWRHQAQAAEALHEGRSVALTTGTASGKSLGYLLPAIAATRSPASGTALYLAPTKALAHDQLRTLRDLGLADWRVAVVDGDSDPDDRSFAREHAAYLLTNPDLLHCAMLPQHPRWARFLAGLRVVVVDEAHRYRGVFGAHVAAVLRRLRRLTAHHGADPVFAVTSATTVDGAGLTRELTGLSDVVVVDADASLRGELEIRFWQPEGWAEDETAELLAAGVRARRQTVAFVGTRRGAETVALRARGLAGGSAAVQPYRAGYLATDRRRVERGLRDRSVLGVAATNALELGIDLAGVDEVIVCGYPGTRAAFRQQAGRAGRRGQPARVTLVASPTPLDSYLLDHPESLLDQPVEAAPVGAENPTVLAAHLMAAAQELPVTEADERFFGPQLAVVVGELTDRALLRRRPGGWFWTRPDRAVDQISLRTAARGAVDVVESATGQVLGQVDEQTADAYLHPGAVYLHQGEAYLCEELDHDLAEALVRAERPGYLTQPLVSTGFTVTTETATRPLGGGVLHLGEVAVTSRVTGYLRRDEVTREVWDSTPLDLPVRTLSAHAAWWHLAPTRAPADLDLEEADAGLHALEHVAAGLLPVFASSDRHDVAFQSTTDHPQVAGWSILVHERHPGGLGFVRRAFEQADPWLAAVLDRLESCPCEDGCPGCVLSGTCATPARRLDKLSARRLAACFVVGRTGTPASRG